MDRLYLFLDEGGNFDFSPTGTKYFTMTCVAMKRPFSIRDSWDDYRHDLIEYGKDIEYFHCAEDNRHVRSKVFEIISNSLNSLTVDSLIVEKAKTHPSLRADSRFYPEMLGYLLRYVFQHATYEEVIVITDTIPHTRKRKAVEKGIKSTLAKMLPTGVLYRILHQASRAHYGLQVADYCNWAIYRKWTTGESEHYNSIQPAITSEFEIFQAGKTWFY